MDSEAHLERVIDAISEEKDQLEAEIERLRALVEDAYFEGSDDSVHGYGRDWLGSKSAAALQPKEK